MRINSMTIDSFGVFHNRAFDFSNGNLHLIYGKNENGKSTLLSFVRSVLFGYSRRSGEHKLFTSWDTSVKGSISFRLRDGSDGSVYRSWRTVDSEETAFEGRLAGESIDSPTLFEAMGCSDRDFFANFFGFSYMEQATGEKKLRADNLSRVIYGLSVGDADRFENARQKLLKRSDELFKKTGSRPKLNVAITNFQDARSAVDVVNSTVDYRKLKEEYDRLQNEYTALQKEAARLRSEGSHCKTLEKAYDDYRLYQERCSELSRFKKESEFDIRLLTDFSEEKETRYREKESEANNLLHYIEKERKEIAELKLEMDNAQALLNPRYAEVAKDIERISERIVGFEEGEDGIVRKGAELDGVDRTLVASLIELGAVLDDASSDVSSEDVAKYRALVEDALILEAARQGKEETELHKIEDENSRNRRRLQHEVEEAQDALDKVKLDLEKTFGSVDLNVLLEENDSVRTNYSAVETRINGAGASLIAQRKLIQKDESLAKSLFASAVGAGAEPDAAELERFIVEAERLSEPIGFDANYDRWQKAVQKVEREESALSVAEKELDALRREIEIKDADFGVGRVEEELRRAVESRDRLWNRVKELLLTQDERTRQFYEYARNEAAEYETAVVNADRYGEDRYSKASAHGEVVALQTRLTSDTRRVREQRERYEELCKDRDAIVEETKSLLKRCGFGFCEDWSLETIHEWLSKWQEFKDSRSETAYAWDDLRGVARKILDDFKRVVALARKWNVEGAADVAFPDAIDDLDSVAFLLDSSESVKTLLNRVQNRVKIYNDFCQRRRDAENYLLTKQRDLSSNESSIVANNEGLATLEESRVEFCESLPFELSSSARQSWSSIGAALEKLRRWQDEVASYIQDRKDHINRAQKYRELSLTVDEIAEKLGVERVSTVRLDFDVKTWRDVAQNAVKAQERYQYVESSFKKKSAGIELSKRELIEVQRELESIEKETNVSHDEFRLFCDYSRRLRDLRKARKESKTLLEKSLNVSGDSERFDERLGELENGEQREFKLKAAELDSEAMARDEEARAKSERCGELRNELKRLRGIDDETEKWSKYQTTLAELRAGIDEFAPIQLALSALEGSLKRFESERIPRILRDAGDFMSRITDGRFKSIERNDGEETKKGRAKKAEDPTENVRFNEGEGVGYRACFSNGSFVDASDLSQATLEQLLFAIRFALVEEYCRAPGAEPLPVIMDDVLVQFDDHRSKNVLNLLKEIASDQSRQFILMTHHESARELFREVVGEEGIVNL